MSVAGLRPTAWLIAALTSAPALLVFSADAAAKFTCEERGAAPEGMALRGLPASPVARRAYTLTLTSSKVSGVNPSPYLGTAYCGRGRDPGRWPNGSFRRVTGSERGVFALQLRFPRAGPWAVSVMDMDGTFRDFGLRRVRAAGGKDEVAPEKVDSPRGEITAASSANRSRGFPALPLGAGLAFLVLTAGLGLGTRRLRGG